MKDRLQTSTGEVQPVPMLCPAFGFELYTKYTKNKPRTPPRYETLH